MSVNWFERVRSSIPRGFSRLYIMQLLKEKPMTGREIIKTAKEQSEGRWTPSPGLVYPLLGRLAAQGLIEEAEEGGYTLTQKGVKELEQISRIKRGISEQYDIFTSLGVAGRFFVNDVVDRLITFTSTVREDIDRLGEKQRARYRKFLKSELQRLEKDNKKQKSEEKKEKSQ